MNITEQDSRLLGEELAKYMENLSSFEVSGKMQKNVLFSNVIMRQSPPIKIEYDTEESSWIVSFDAEGIDIYSSGDTKEGALKNFWDYVFDLLPSLFSREENLSSELKAELDFLRSYFILGNVHAQRS